MGRRAHHRDRTELVRREEYKVVSRSEGIIPALETSHAFAATFNNLSFKPSDVVVINVSGRGDKDMEMICNYDPKSTSA